MRVKETCEVCGKDGVFGIVQIEGAKMRVCKGCAYGKKILYYLDDEPSGKGGSPSGGDFFAPVKPKQQETEDIVDDYGKKIRVARDKLGVTMAVIGEKINESRGYLERIEREETRPTIAVAKKLEKELGIKLIEKTTETVTPTISKQKFSEPTLGDMIEDKGEG